MLRRAGFEMDQRCAQPTPMILSLHIHQSSVFDLIEPDHLRTAPSVPGRAYHDLFGSPCCKTAQLSEIAWARFGGGPAGWARVQAICDFVHGCIEIGYELARCTRTAWQTCTEGVGVCRDSAHLAIALRRCMNIPARYCTELVDVSAMAIETS